MENILNFDSIFLFKLFTEMPFLWNIYLSTICKCEHLSFFISMSVCLSVSFLPADQLWGHFKLTLWGLSINLSVYQSIQSYGLKVLHVVLYSSMYKAVKVIIMSVVIKMIVSLYLMPGTISYWLLPPSAATRNLCYSWVSCGLTALFMCCSKCGHRVNLAKWLTMQHSPTEADNCLV